MPKLRHIAIATNDPKATAEFYKQAFGFEQVGETSPSSPLASGYFLSDGTLNIAVLKFKTDQLGKQGNRVKESCGDKACEEVVVPCGDFALEAQAVFSRRFADQVDGDVL
jgi:catechol 2,3-dioxygenase-like lactoylglutathione lyase family enzyme